MVDCGSVPCIFNVISEPSGIMIGVFVVLVGFAVLYRYREALRGKPAYVYIGLVIIILLAGTFFAGIAVLSQGEHVHSNTPVGVSIDQDAGSTARITMVDTGNLDSAGIVGPDGERSAFGSTDDLLQAGATMRVAEDAAFDRNPDPANATKVNNSLGSTVLNNDTLLVASEDGTTATLLEECYISHSADVVSGVYVDKAGIGCSGLTLAEYAAPAGSDEIAEAQDGLVNEFGSTVYQPTAAGDVNASPVTDPAEASSLSTGSHIQYEAGAEYSVIGTIDGTEGVIQSFTTAEARVPEREERNEDDHRTASYRQGSGYLRVAGISSLTPAGQELTRGQRKSRLRGGKG